MSQLLRQFTPMIRPLSSNLLTADSEEPENTLRVWESLTSLIPETDLLRLL